MLHMWLRDASLLPEKRSDSAARCPIHYLSALRSSHQGVALQLRNSLTARYFDDIQCSVPSPRVVDGGNETV